MSLGPTSIGRHGTRARILAALISACAPGAHAYAALPEQDEARLARGEVVTQIITERGPGGRLRAAVDIPASPRDVWQVMLDCAGAPNFVPGLEACRIVETAGDGSFDIREHRVRWNALFPRLTLRFRSDYVVDQQIRVMRVSGDLAAMEGGWRLEPREEGRATRLHYDFRIVPRTPLPAALVRAGLQRDAQRVLLAVRAQVLRRSGS